MFMTTRSLWVCTCLWFMSVGVHGQVVLVKPYVQPGAGSQLVDADVKVLCWLTDQTPAEFTVEYVNRHNQKKVITPERTALDFGKAPVAKPATESKTNDNDPPEKTGDLPTEQEQHYFRYTAKLTELPFNTKVKYIVRQGKTVIRADAFYTRHTADQAVRFAIVGDLANGKEHQKAIAYQLAERQPELMLALGDIVYPAGRVSQYMSFFWKTYNDVDQPSINTGAPLMASMPIYPVLGNHDVAAKFPTIPDALGVYYFFQPPQNGPGLGSWTTALGSDAAAKKLFLERTKESYPHIDAYSFDHGPVHVLVLNSNSSGNATQAKLRQWVETDLKNSKQRWKVVCYHNPTFSSSHQHYTEQSVRLWQPLLQDQRVDFVFTGHVHNYQRTFPLQFTPTSTKRDSKGRVDGEFVIDRQFDGEKNLLPKGIIHFVAGGGGASLYGPSLEKTKLTLKKEHGDNYADYTAKMIVDQHSFLMAEVSNTEFKLTAHGIKGDVLDQIRVRKP